MKGLHDFALDVQRCTGIKRGPNARDVLRQFKLHAPGSEWGGRADEVSKGRGGIAGIKLKVLGGAATLERLEWQEPPMQ